MRSVGGVPIQVIVADPEWQALRRSLLGRWKREEAACVAALRAYLAGDPACSWRRARVRNYLTGSGFRLRVIGGAASAQLREELQRDAAAFHLAPQRGVAAPFTTTKEAP